MRMVLLAIAAGALFGSAAQAKDDLAAMAAGPQPAQTAKKVLYVCSEDEQSWRAFSRDLGTPDFVTAKQVLADQDKTWSGPRCITKTELHRLANMTSGPAR